MASSLYCYLCGCALVDYESQNRYVHSWLKYFRAIYSSPTGTYVSGVGLYDESVTSRCIAPLEYTARWNDPGYTFPQDDEIGVLNRKPVNGRYGFVFHESCWSLLEQSFCPEQVPVVLLYEDPCVVPEIKSLLGEAPDDAPLETCRSWPASGNDDLFSMVPQEIRDIIISYLPTADVCRLRLTSKAFVYTFSSQQFWRSRFQKGGERAWLCEIQGLPEVSNWRWLYRRTNPALLPPALLNRRRVSGLINQVQDVLQLKWNEESARHSLITQVSATRWREVSANIRPCPARRRFNFDEGCREFRTRTIQIPEQLAEVSFSILVLNRTKYVTGIRVTANDGTALSIGYSADNTWCSESVTSLNGFKLAIGSRGVEGIQVIHGGGTASRWFGSPDRAPHTNRLVCSKGISALEAGFDGFKMVRLSVQAAQFVTDEPNHEKSLLHTALWYPDVPTHGLHFTDTQNGVLRPYHAPLMWTSFGGPAGINLRHLRGISVQDRAYPLIRGIKLNFDANVPDECSHVLGVYSLQCDDFRVTNFAIDGPGGEIIEKVRMSEGGDPRVGGVEITTNWGRSFRFGGFKSNSPENKSLDIPVGNTITGFYANYSLTFGLTGIGVISELVDIQNVLG
ncbi:hypothetical protein BDW42DRAFT_114121 [Aspergillus taichungensis]|uniref:F-box domain-containing protein n=1 Tax=Aspergillus taichungensis TaxID=482145 RepID=A0A2J5HT32_9EURO|nr:hypothetical protein BDW42DRAFT_114121 [Aspergillus taichungensis]